MTGTVDISVDGDAVARRVAEWVLERALATAGRFAWCLSGGSTPKTTFGVLASDAFRNRFPWDRTHIFFGDERFVPPDHPDSNYRMAREAMISHVPIPAEQVHPWQTIGTDPEHSALHYADTLKRFYGADTLDPARPLFDVMFLGLGEDGHTASLFPGVAALKERTAWTAAVIGAKPEPRLTLSYPVIDSSRVVAFLAAGEGKRDILAKALAGDTSLPAVGVKPIGELCWFTDKAAAGT
ncbi:6-phosphogluconolactonase [Acidisphaera sp. L21]|uniref:6-phosphogluconolactonase n=1 Tax=Acidisphaera sp. L21 TaxID=1641851 RepID=UPI00131B7F84|nr:6-phosphogluconolactonase [Acidisphaera sp. L21]